MQVIAHISLMIHSALNSSTALALRNSRAVLYYSYPHSLKNKKTFIYTRRLLKLCRVRSVDYLRNRFLDLCILFYKKFDVKYFFDLLFHVHTVD